MPITPAHTWQESPTWVTIHVVLRSVSPSNVDILTTECYVKVNCAPYLFQIDLFGDIETTKSSAVVDNGIVRFFLVKKQESLWGRLNAIGERKDLLLRREKSLELERERSNKLKADFKAKSAQLGRAAVQNQMKLDEEKRKLVEERKAAELKCERDIIQTWQKDIRGSTCLTNDGGSSSEILLANSVDSVTAFLKSKSSAEKTLDVLDKTKNLQIECCGDKNEDSWETIFRNAEKPAASTSSILSPPRQNFQEAAWTAILPPPRRSASVRVTFTSKTLSSNLPARESRENVQLKEQTTAECDTVDISERDPLFLQDKGDDFYIKGNFRSAVNAYSKALQKDSSLFLCYANRAASLLFLKQFKACIGDCTSALQILLKAKTSDSTELGVQSLSGGHQSSYTASIENATKSDGFDVSCLKTLIQESLTLLCKNTRSNDDNPSEWHKVARKQILVRRATALCRVADLEKAKLDFDEVLGVKLSEKEIENVSNVVNSYFGSHS